MSLKYSKIIHERIYGKMKKIVGETYKKTNHQETGINNKNIQIVAKLLGSSAQDGYLTDAVKILRTTRMCSFFLLFNLYSKKLLNKQNFS